LHAGVTVHFGYDAIHELLSATQAGIGTESYTYDANGNTTSKTDSTGATTYSWDYENRLTSATLPGSGGTVSYRYDPFGRRIYKSSTSGTSIYTYDLDNVVEETNSAGAAVARYSQSVTIDEPLAELRSGATSFYEQDGLGSVTSLSNAAGAVASNYTYDSFGNLVATSGSIVNNFRYTARELDTETNLYFYRARYYDQTTGRFMSEDPVGFRGGQIDFYPYVKNSPLNFADPLGHKPWNKVQAFGNCVDGCVKTMVSSNFCTLKKNLRRVFVAGPIAGTAVCVLVVASEPYLAPAFVPCEVLSVGSILGIGTAGSIGRWNIENLSSGTGCTAFCAMNEL